MALDKIDRKILALLQKDATTPVAEIGRKVADVAALLGLVVFIGALCGLVTWALVHLITAGIS